MSAPPPPSDVVVDAVEWFLSPNVLATVAAASAVLVVVGYYVATAAASRGPRKVLPLDDFVAVPLVKKEVLSRDTRRFTFGLPDNHTLGLETCQHLTLKYFDAADGGKAVQRSYTPVTDDTSVGCFSLCVKVYRPLPPKFPRGGLMSQHLDDLPIGGTVLIKGPKGHVQWRESGNFCVKPLGKPLEDRSADQLVLVAGGTGITPMLQILHAVFRHPQTSLRNQHLRCKLLYANQTPDDILVRDELESLARDFPERFQLWYTVDRVPDDAAPWTYSTGFVSVDMIREHAHYASGRTQYFLCGPPPMIKFACLPALQELGCTDKDWVVL
jgi:cytochrome-b5 reductase